MNFFQKLFGKSKPDNFHTKQTESEQEEPTADIKILLERAKKKIKKNNKTTKPEPGWRKQFPYFVKTMLTLPILYWAECFS